MNIDTIPASIDGQAQDLQSQHRSAAATPASAFHGGPINILIVDDEPKNLTVLETVLDDPGYRLVRAESADQALLALVVEEFALLILDIRMPGMTGFELAEMIKERKKTARVPIIFLTAYYNEDQHVLEGYGTGAVDYLHKPVNPAILRSKVAVFAELHSKNRENALANRALLAEVTERRRAEEQLRELNDTLEQRVTERTEALLMSSAALNEAGERYRSLFDGSLDAIFTLGADKRFEAANPAALRLTACTLEELKTIHFLDLCVSDQREAAENAFRAAFRRQCVTVDTTVITATGERRDLFISAAPTIVAGEVVGVSCIARDITERKQAQEAVQLSEARLGSIISSAMDAIITIDEGQRVTDFNNSAEQMFRCAAADALGQPIDRFIAKRSWALHGSPIEAFGNTQVTKRQMGALGSIFGHRPDGEEFPIEASISQLRTPTGTFYTVILRDITERERSEEALRASEARLRAFSGQMEELVHERTEELERSQGRLRALTMELNLAEQRERKRLAGELHDYLAQLLVVCRLNLGQLRRDGLPATAEARVKETEEVLNHALNYSRTLMAELSPPILQEHGLPAGLTWLGKQMGHRGLTVTVDAGPAPDWSLSGETAMLLFQSVRELLMNALKHAGSTEVAIKLEQVEKTLRIMVRDQGKGFELAAAACTASDTPTAMSSKFGLFSIRERMRALGGWFDLQSAPGKGTTATLVLPLGGDAAAGSELKILSPELVMNSKLKPDKSTPHQQATEIRVLLVDDHAMVRQGLRSVLDAHPDVTVVGEAGDGEEAVAAVEALQPSLVVMDINMPKMNGIEATAEITSRHPGIVVIGLSVNAGGANEEAMKKAGAAMLLTKEAAVEELYQAIRGALSTKVTREG